MVILHLLYSKFKTLYLYNYIFGISMGLDRFWFVALLFWQDGLLIFLTRIICYASVTRAGKLSSCIKNTPHKPYPSRWYIASQMKVPREGNQWLPAILGKGDGLNAFPERESRDRGKEMKACLSGVKMTAPCLRQQTLRMNWCPLVKLYPRKNRGQEWGLWGHL